MFSFPSTPKRPAIPVFGVTPNTLAEKVAELPAQSAAWVEANAFFARTGAALVVPGVDGKPGAVLLGVDPAEKHGDFAAGALVAKLPTGNYRLAEGFSDPLEAALAFALSSYRFDAYKSTESRQIPKLMAPCDLEEVGIVAGWCEASARSHKHACQ